MELINRQDALKAIDDVLMEDEQYKVWLKLSIKNIKPVDAEPFRHGKWIYGNDFHWYTASCNECGYQRRTDIKADRWNQWNYCPNCGARMDA